MVALMPPPPGPAARGVARTAGRAAQGRRHQGVEQRVAVRGGGLNSGVDLHADEPRVDGWRQFHDLFGELLALGQGRDRPARPCAARPGVHVGLVAVAVASVTTSRSAVRQRARGHVAVLARPDAWCCAGRNLDRAPGCCRRASSTVMSAMTGRGRPGRTGAVGVLEARHVARNSMVATCMPRQMPRGDFASRRTGREILPSMPRLPNPPGTSTRVKLAEPVDVVGVRVWSRCIRSESAHGSSCRVASASSSDL